MPHTEIRLENRVCKFSHTALSDIQRYFWAHISQIPPTTHTHAADKIIVLCSLILGHYIHNITFWTDSDNLSAAFLEGHLKVMCCSQWEKRKRRVFWASWRNWLNHVVLMMVSQISQQEWVRWLWIANFCVITEEISMIMSPKLCSVEPLLVMEV